MTTSYQEQKTIPSEHAPVWISVVSGLTGEAPLTREHAKRRLVVLLIFVALILATITAALLYQALR